MIFRGLHFDLNAVTLDSPFDKTFDQGRRQLAQLRSKHAVGGVNNDNSGLEIGQAAGLAQVYRCDVLIEMCQFHEQSCVRQDLAQVFGSDWPQAIDQLTTWLQALDISPRDLRHTAEGREALLQALSSARGRNFIGSKI